MIYIHTYITILPGKSSAWTYQNIFFRVANTPTKLLQCTQTKSTHAGRHTQTPGELAQLNRPETQVSIASWKLTLLHPLLQYHTLTVPTQLTLVLAVWAFTWLYWQLIEPYSILHSLSYCFCCKEENNKTIRVLNSIASIWLDVVLARFKVISLGGHLSFFTCPT